MDIKKIVVGIDFSEESENAARHAVNIARHVGAEVVLAHVGVVVEPSGQANQPVHPSVKEWEELLNKQLAADRQRLEDMRARLQGEGIAISHVVVDGFPDTALVAAGKQAGADLLIVGTHGRTGLKRFFLGSVSERVVRLSETSVMVARPTGDGAGGYRRILVPVDFSRPSEAAVDMALTLAHPGTAIELVHFWQIPITVATPYAAIRPAEEALTTVRSSMIELAENSGKRLLERYQGNAKGAQVTFHSIEAAPASGIQERLEQGDYDLLVMGSHGRRGVRRFLLGSVAEVTVRHAPCSTVVVHVPRDAAEDSQA